MPELPEVETVAQALRNSITQQKVIKVNIYKDKLRWEIPKHLQTTIQNKKIISIHRRAKYLIINFTNGALIIHLGMSGSIKICAIKEKLIKHEHFELEFANNTCLRFKDPRRFGSIHWQENQQTIKLLQKLGPEPLEDDFNAKYIFNVSRGKKQNVKTFIMNAKIVVGIGNIYASESLFYAGISPTVKAGEISLAKYQKLVKQIKLILEKAIDKGGTTLKDFANVDGDLGYFSQKLAVYGMADKPCKVCKNSIKKILQNQRASYYCPKCQK